MADAKVKNKGKEIIDALKEQLKDVENLKPLSYYQKDFEELLTGLAAHSEYNFYVHLIFNMHAKLSYSVPTAGVYYKNEQFHIDVNPKFMYELLKTPKDRLATLIHEVLHPLYFHFNRVKTRNPKLWNIAGDLCINQFLFKKLDSDSVLKQIGCDLGEKFNFPPNLTAEQYYELLIQKQEENKKKKEQKKQQGGQGQQGEGGDEDEDDLEDYLNMDDLLDSDEISEAEKEIIKNQLQEIVKRARDKCRGTLPDEVLSIIDLLFAPPVVDWRQHLRHVTGNKKINKETTIKRRSRRFQDRMDINGKLKRSGFSVACIVDVSGSMDDAEIVKGLSEIKSICQWSNSTMTLVQVDTEASEPEEFSVFNKKFNRKRSGGTYLYPGIEKLDERGIEYNALIIITDGEIEKDWPKILKVPVFFLTTSGHLYFDTTVSPLYRKFDLNTKKQ